jgi:hypothetical protein
MGVVGSTAGGFSRSSRMEMGVVGSTAGGGGGSIAGECHQLHVAQKVLYSDDQGGSLGATTASV